MLLYQITDLVNDAEVTIEDLNPKSEYPICATYELGAIPREMWYREVINICTDRSGLWISIR